jgi:diguanylate cyclase (GGDEF)-like protein
MSAESWSAQQLAEFLAAVGSTNDERAALHVAVERAAESLEAEIGAFVRQGLVLSSVGFASDDEPTAILVEAAEGGMSIVELPGIGSCTVLRAAVLDPTPGCLVLARVGTGSFDRSEAGLLAGMGRVLGLALLNLRRHVMLERLTAIQRSIARRAPLQDVLDAIVESAAELFGDEVLALRLRDPEDPAFSITHAVVGFDPNQADATRRIRMDSGIGGQAILEDRVVVFTDYRNAPNAVPIFADAELQTAMAVPVRQEGVAVGSIMVGSYRRDRTYSSAEQEMLETFAEHASVALNDARTVEALHRAVDDATHQALHDNLTGLPNRALFLDRLNQALARTRRNGTFLGVLFVDLDDFKLANDSLGHITGDALLMQVADRLTACLRSGDTAARLGGDEFAVVVESTDRVEPLRVAERLLDGLSPSILVGSEQLIVGASIGVAIADPSSTADQLIRNADVAMYRVKAEGKGHYAVFEPEMHEMLLRRRELDSDLRRAIDANELRLVYQPIVSQSGDPIGVEALVRWQHPTAGLLAPDRFIPAAEESGLIVPLGHWVLDEACRQLREWRDTGVVDDRFCMSVNLSPRELVQSGQAAHVARTITRHGLDPASIVLEVTETVLMRDSKLAEARLRALKHVGVKLALDDFGTGYSSLAHLRRFPVDILKIDKAFVDGLAGGSEDAAVARAVVQLGEALHLKTLAEGVEHADQAECLTSLGCGLMQGFYFARPLTPEGAADYLMSTHNLAAVARSDGALKA